MSGLALYFEQAGLSTVAIALVREHAQEMKPPRALWVPFPLGRPFGPPDDPDLQRRIIVAAFALLDADAGPLLEDFPDVPTAAPAPSAETPWVCPVSFPAPAADPNDRLTPLLDEIRALAPWYERARERRGRSTVGLSGRPVEEGAGQLVAMSAPGALESEAATAELVDALRWAADDLKAYYLEAASAQGGSGALEEIEAWFWRETEAARLLRDLRLRCLAQSDPALQDLGEFMLVPDNRV